MCALVFLVGLVAIGVTGLSVLILAGSVLGEALWATAEWLFTGLCAAAGLWVLLGRR